MSTATSLAIVARLTGTESLTGNPLAVKALASQTRLATLLTTDPNTGAALTMTDPITGAVTARQASDCVRWGSKGANAVFPEITFRPSAGVPNKTFSDGSFAVDDGAYDFEIWDNSNSGTLMTDIMDCLLDLLDRRYGAPQLPMVKGISFWVETLVTPVAWYDTQIKSWFLLWRVRVTEGR